MLQRPGHPPLGHRGAGAVGVEGPADGTGSGRRGDAGLGRGNQPDQPGAPRLGRERPEGVGPSREEDRIHDRGHRGRRLCPGMVDRLRELEAPGRAERAAIGSARRPPGHPSQHCGRLSAQGGAACRGAGPSGGPRRGGGRHPRPDRAHRAHPEREMGRKRARNHEDRHPHAGDVGLRGCGGRI